MESLRYETAGKEIVLFPAEKENSPLLVLNSFTDDADSLRGELKKLSLREHNLLCISKLEWENDLSPWEAPPAFAKEAPFGGGADAYLALLLDVILPGAEERIKGKPAFTALAGYSMAGLFALYAAHETERFDRLASVSGSLWFPGFKDHVFSHPMKKKPDKVYLSLGDREDRSGSALLRSVRENTEAIAAHYKEQGLNVTMELNPGNHFKDPGWRIAKGLACLLADKDS
ncbi:MAG: alpha/beta hydrolase [Lachnospiraceae bacterium]|nr:alpha/beta hydrolase [Lachnospiraceae bacterium]